MSKVNPAKLNSRTLPRSTIESRTATLTRRAPVSEGLVENEMEIEDLIGSLGGCGGFFKLRR